MQYRYKTDSKPRKPNAVRHVILVKNLNNRSAQNSFPILFFTHEFGPYTGKSARLF